MLECCPHVPQNAAASQEAIKLGTFRFSLADTGASDPVASPHTLAPPQFHFHGIVDVELSYVRVMVHECTAIPASNLIILIVSNSSRIIPSTNTRRALPFGHKPGELTRESAKSTRLTSYQSSKQREDGLVHRLQEEVDSSTLSVCEVGSLAKIGRRATGIYPCRLLPLVRCRFGIHILRS
jgi:hypothetical protein